MTSEEEHLNERMERLRFKRAYLLYKIDSENKWKSMGYRSFSDFADAAFPNTNYATLRAMAGAGKFLRMTESGEVYSIVAEKKVVNNISGEERIVDYDLSILEQMRKLTLDRFKSLHEQGVINFEMKQKEIKELMKNY